MKIAPAGVGTGANPSGRRIRIGSGVFTAIRTSTIPRRRNPYCAKLLTNKNCRSRMWTCAERLMVKTGAIIGDFDDWLIAQ